MPGHLTSQHWSNHEQSSPHDSVTVFPNFYDVTPGSLPVPVKTPSKNVPASHNAVPKVYFATRLAAMNLV